MATSGIHATAAPTYIGSQVLAFARSKLGKKVGDGECATLIVEAVKAARGIPFSRLGPTGLNADYVWGKLITKLTPGGGSVASVRPGDVIQFRNVSFTKVVRTQFANGSGSRTMTSTSSYGHHTAVVSAVRGNLIDLLQQNVGASGKSENARKIVQTGTIWGKSFTSTGRDSAGNTITTTYRFNGGTMWVYRPYK